MTCGIWKPKVALITGIGTPNGLIYRKIRFLFSLLVDDEVLSKAFVD